MNSPNDALIHTVPAAAQLRRVSGFDPLKFLRQTTSEKTGQTVLKLDLPYKRLWFRLACPNGRMLLNPLRITDQQAIYEAMIYTEKEDSQPLARVTATATVSETPDGKYIEFAQDAALDEALENAGFGIQLCDLIEGAGRSGHGSEVIIDTDAMRQAAAAAKSEKSETRNAVPPHTPVPALALAQTPAPVPVPAQTSTSTSAPVEAPRQNPVDTVKPSAVQAPPETAPAAPNADNAENTTVIPFPMKAPAGDPPAMPQTTAQAAPSANYTADMTVEEIVQRMTLDEAKAVVVTSGTCKGWTLAQVSERRPASLRFYVCSPAVDNVLKAAAQIVLEAAQR